VLNMFSREPKRGEMALDSEQSLRIGQRFMVSHFCWKVATRRLFSLTVFSFGFSLVWYRLSSLHFDIYVLPRAFTHALQSLACPAEITAVYHPRVVLDASLSVCELSFFLARC